MKRAGEGATVGLGEARSSLYGAKRTRALVSGDALVHCERARWLTMHKCVTSSAH